MAINKSTSSGGIPECNFGSHMGSIIKLYKEFMGDKKVQKEILNPDRAFVSIIENEFRMPSEFLAFRNDISKGDVKGLGDRIKNIRHAAADGHLGGKFAGLFYTPESFAKKDPMIRKLLDDYVHISHDSKAKDQEYKTIFKTINGLLYEEMGVRGLVDNGLVKFGKKFTRKDAQSKVNKIEEEIIGLRVKLRQGDFSGEQRLRTLEKERSDLYTESELQVNTEFISIIENALPKLIDAKIKKAAAEGKDLKYEIKSKPKDPFLTMDDLSKLKDADGNPLSKSMRKATHEYMKLTDQLYWRMRKGVEAYVELVAKGKTKNKEDFEAMRDNLLEKLMPNKEKGFYPHFSTELNIEFLDGLMPKIEDLVLASNDYFQGNISLKQAIDNVNGYITGHTKKRTTSKEMDDYSYNFKNVLSAYMDNVNRFNYINYTNKATKDVLSHVEKMYKTGKDSSGYGDSVVEFIHDLHQAATGMNEIQNPQMNQMVRSLLGLEFISKIGFNPRSAARNSTQILLNFVEFGPIQWKKASDFFEANKINVDEALKESGLLFFEGAPELTESIGMAKPGIYTMTKYNKSTGKLEHIPLTKLDKTAQGVNWLAGKSGWMMARVENWNRKSTFKVGYSQMYRMLEHQGFDNYVKNLPKNQRYKDKAPKTGWDKIIQAERHHMAKKYAINMTTMLHFDYSGFSKSKALRSTTGKFLGQFQHYGFSFFEYNYNLFRKAKNDILMGEMGGNNAWKAYRMSMVYFLAPAIASIATGVDFSNLLQHDSAERLNKIYVGFMGDEEEKKKAFYGRGPVIGSIGAPIISDLMNVGMLYDFVNMDEESLLALLSGYEDMSGMDDDKKLYQLIRTLHTATGRIWFRTLPQLTKGNIGWAGQTELGLYPSKEVREQREYFEEIDPGILDALQRLEEFGR